MAPRFSHLCFRIDAADGTVATARAELLWDKAPRTCDAISSSLPIETYAWHGRNSGDEALLCTPNLISHLPQDASENATTEHTLGDVMFGFEPAGFCYGGAGSEDASEIAWICEYPVHALAGHPARPNRAHEPTGARAPLCLADGNAAQACYWVSEKGPPHTEGPYRRVAATLNVFGRIVEEDGFYACSRRLIKSGQQRVRVWAE